VPALRRLTSRRPDRSELSDRPCAVARKSQKGQIDIILKGIRSPDVGTMMTIQNLSRTAAEFLRWNAADFGWGGDTTQNILCGSRTANWITSIRKSSS